MASAAPSKTPQGKAAPTKAPDAPGSTKPQGPNNPANVFYPKLDQTSKPQPAGDTSDPWRGNGIQTKPNGAVATKGAEPVKKTPLDDGNQGKHNRKHKDIKENGSAAKMRPIESPDSTKALKKGAALSMYPHLK